MADPSLYYYWMWNQITSDGNVILDAYWADLSPQHPSAAWSWNWLQASGERSFNCSWFQVGNSVLGYTFTYVSWGVAGSCVVDIYLTDTSWNKLSYERHVSTWQLVANWYAKYYTELALLPWQLWSNVSNYRLFFQATHSAGYVDTKYLEFSLSNMYFDTSTYSPWMMTVSWTNLVYTDYWWYKHMIQYDGNYSWSNVWTSNSWKIRVQNWVIRRLYYVDDYWYVRRTYEADNRYWSTSWQWAYAGTSYKWALRTASSWASWASARYLCFVNSDWYKMRLMNWNPANF